VLVAAGLASVSNVSPRSTPRTGRALRARYRWGHIDRARFDARSGKRHWLSTRERDGENWKRTR